MRAVLAMPAVAVQFLTIVPVRLPRVIPEGAFPGAVALFPVIGLAIGVVVAGVDALLGQVLPVTVTSGVDLLLLAVLTGGLHLDGLADAADGLLGNLPRERRLAVMREGGVGAFGAAALVFALLLEYGGLVSLGPVIRPAALVVAVALSRWTMSLLLWAFPYARAEGAGSAFRSGLRLRHPLVATLFAVIIAAAVFSAAAALLLVISGGVGLLVGFYALRRLGGCTGDVYGAAGELAFAATLVTITGLAR
jgi:adenosylcobinamide-GDP ribazoletransferase